MARILRVAAAVAVFGSTFSVATFALAADLAPAAVWQLSAPNQPYDGAATRLKADAVDMDSAVEQCAIVAAGERSSEQGRDSQFSGLCIGATSEYIGSLNGSGAPASIIGSELADYVVQLAQLLRQQTCRHESEIPQAIAMAGAASNDPEQAMQIKLISQTIRRCDFVTTAAINAAGVPNGVQASAN